MEKTDTNYTFHDTLRGSGIYCDHAGINQGAIRPQQAQDLNYRAREKDRRAQGRYKVQRVVS